MNLRKLLRIPSRLAYEWRRLRCLLIARKFSRAGKGFMLGNDSVIVGAGYIEVGDDFVALSRTRIEAWDQYRDDRYEPKIIFGENVTMNYDCHIGAIHRVELGNNVMLASRVYITDHFHGSTEWEDLIVPPAHRRLVSKGPVVIEDDVWIGEGAVILPGVRIGKNSVVGANAVVTKDVPPFSVVAGVPAKVIRIVTPAGSRVSDTKSRME
jgi:acetyltransferase-like isoleucine patch superfamily enzyme